MNEGDTAYDYIPQNMCSVQACLCDLAACYLSPGCPQLPSSICCFVDLVSNLTVPEMVGQLGNAALSIERLDIPNYQWWSEALHGLAGSPGISYKGKVH